MVVVVVVGVVVVVLGRSWTLVRGTQVYSGSGTNPGGTTAVSGSDGGHRRGLVGVVHPGDHEERHDQRRTVDVRIRPLMM